MMCQALLWRSQRSWRVQAVAARTLLEWGKLEGEAHRLRTSIDHFDIALSLLDAPDERVDLLNDRGVALYELDELEEARIAFMQTVDLQPRHSRALTNLGLILWAEGSKQQALQMFDRAVHGRGASNPHALNNRGALQFELGEAQESLPDFHKALDLDPGYEVARRNRDAALAELAEPVPLPPVEEPVGCWAPS